MFFTTQSSNPFNRFSIAISILTYITIPVQLYMIISSSYILETPFAFINDGEYGLIALFFFTSVFCVLIIQYIVITYQIFLSL